jgi:hypothetical protein
MKVSIIRWQNLRVDSLTPASSASAFNGNDDELQGAIPWRDPLFGRLAAGRWPFRG